MNVRLLIVLALAVVAAGCSSGGDDAALMKPKDADSATTRPQGGGNDVAQTKPNL